MCSVFHARTTFKNVPIPSNSKDIEFSACNNQRCADMYPHIDILQISAILTDTDKIRIVISLFERIRMLCHGYSTDMHYTFILFYFLNFKFKFELLVGITWGHLQCRRQNNVPPLEMPGTQIVGGHTTAVGLTSPVLPGNSSTTIYSKHD